MKKYITVEVKQKHINKGEQGNAHTCAIAQSLTELFDADEVNVEENEITIKKSNGLTFELTWGKLPEFVNRFIERFDDDKKKVKPFKFKLPFIKI